MTDRRWLWPAALDAVRAAPSSHTLMLENDRVRVVEVCIPAGVREPEHTHRWSSVMLIDRPARIRYYGESGALEFESAERGGGEPGRPRVEWLPPEGPHAVENVDSVPYHAVRVELKGRGPEGRPR